MHKVKHRSGRNYESFVRQSNRVSTSVRSTFILLKFTVGLEPRWIPSYSNMYFNAASRPKPTCLHDRLSKEHNNTRVEGMEVGEG